MENKRLITQNLELNYIEGGAGKHPILLLHGSTSRIQTFNPILNELMSYLRVYAYDLRGHGQSTRVKDAYTLNDYVDDTALFINEVIKEPTIVLGHSLGGMVAMMLAAKYPDLVKALIIVDPPLSIQTLWQQGELQRPLASQIIPYLQRKEIDTVYKLMNNDFRAESLLSCDPDMIISMHNNFDTVFGSYQMEKIAPLLHSPILLFRGKIEEGSMVTDADLDIIKPYLPQLNIIELKDRGHSFLTENNTFVENEIKNFINNAIK